MCCCYASSRPAAAICGVCFEVWVWITYTLCCETTTYIILTDRIGIPVRLWVVKVQPFTQNLTRSSESDGVGIHRMQICTKRTLKQGKRSHKVSQICKAVHQLIYQHIRCCEWVEICSSFGCRGQGHNVIRDLVSWKEAVFVVLNNPRAGIMLQQADLCEFLIEHLLRNSHCACLGLSAVFHMVTFCHFM